VKEALQEVLLAYYSLLLAWWGWATCPVHSQLARGWLGCTITCFISQHVVQPFLGSPIHFFLPLACSMLRACLYAGISSVSSDGADRLSICEQVVRMTVSWMTT
jgi:hypothetical protein